MTFHTIDYYVSNLGTITPGAEFTLSQEIIKAAKSVFPINNCVFPVVAGDKYFLCTYKGEPVDVATNYLVLTEINRDDVLEMVSGEHFSEADIACLLNLNLNYELPLILHSSRSPNNVIDVILEQFNINPTPYIAWMISTPQNKTSSIVYFVHDNTPKYKDEDKLGEIYFTVSVPISDPDNKNLITNPRDVRSLEFTINGAAIFITSKHVKKIKKVLSDN